MNESPSAPGRIVIRPAGPDEYDAAGDLTARAYIADGLVAAEHWYVNQLRQAAGRAKDGELLVAVDTAGAIIGTVTLCLPGSPYAEIARDGEAEFRMLAVEPSARRRGTAAALVEACLNRAAAAGCGSLVLSSASAMATAHRLYHRLGFVRDPERDWSPEAGVDLLAFTRSISDRA